MDQTQSQTTQTQATENAAQAKPQPSEATLKRREAEKARRQVKVEYNAKGAAIKAIDQSKAKKTGSKAREIWDLYQPGLTIEELFKLAEATRGGVSYAKACVMWDVRHDLITLEIPAPAPKAEQVKAQ